MEERGARYICNMIRKCYELESVSLCESIKNKSNGLGAGSVFSCSREGVSSL